MREWLPCVRCRPGFMTWFLCLLAAGLGVLLVVAPSLSTQAPQTPEQTQQTRFVFTLLAAACFAVSVLLAISARMTQIVADEFGLRWRGVWKGWKQVGWSEITDYYNKQGQKEQTLSLVTTTQGDLLFSDMAWTHTSALREVVQQRAASAHAREWQILGERDPERWPLTFSYAIGQARFLCGLILAACGLMIGMFIANLIRGWPHLMETYRLMGAVWTAGYIGLAGLVFGMQTFFFLLFLPLTRDTLKRGGQQITLSAQGVRYEDTSSPAFTRIQANWPEIVSISMPPLRRFAIGTLYQIVTRQGTFTFTSGIEQSGLLYRLLSRHAPEAVTHGKEAQPDDEDLLSMQSVRDKNTHVFHFRTRTNRALLWLPCALCLFMPLSILLRRWAGIAMPHPPEPWLPVLCGGVCVYLAWRYFAARVILDERGITQHVPFRTRFLAWQDIQTYHRSGSDLMQYFVVVGKRSKMRVWFGIAHSDRFREEVSRRVRPEVTGSWLVPTSD